MFAPNQHTKPRLRGSRRLLTVSLLLIAGGAPIAAVAQTNPPLVVTTTADTDAPCGAASCTLRAAINAANARPGADLITFAIPGSDPGCEQDETCTIEPNDALPTLTDAATTIDGFSQPGAHPNTHTGVPLDAVWKIVIDGVGLDQCCSPGLHSQGRNVRLRGLHVQHFYDGIYIDDAEGNHVEGNLISNNHCVGALLSGVDGGPGAISNVVGGADADTRNVIGGNGCVGVALGTGHFNHVLGNLIGVDPSGTAAFANASDGVRAFSTATADQIGGTGSGEPNLIAFNQEQGVRVDGTHGAARISINRNSIHSNRDGGILLSFGGNAAKTAPIIAQHTSTQVSGSACPGCSVEVYSDGANQGRLFEGATVADSAGAWSVTSVTPLHGPYITATNTDGLGNTSAFSIAVQLAAPTPTATHTNTPRRTPTATAPASTPTPLPCHGDCDGNGAVTIDEVIRGINIALGSLQLAVCPPADLNLEGQVTIDEIISAVNSALQGCG